MNTDNIIISYLENNEASIDNIRTILENSTQPIQNLDEVLEKLVVNKECNENKIKIIVDGSKSKKINDPEKLLKLYIDSSEGRFFRLKVIQNLFFNSEKKIQDIDNIIISYLENNKANITDIKTILKNSAKPIQNLDEVLEKLVVNKGCREKYVGCYDKYVGSYECIKIIVDGSQSKKIDDPEKLLKLYIDSSEGRFFRFKVIIQNLFFNSEKKIQDIDNIIISYLEKHEANITDIKTILQNSGQPIQNLDEVLKKLVINEGCDDECIKIIVDACKKEPAEKIKMLQSIINNHSLNLTQEIKNYLKSCIEEEQDKIPESIDQFISDKKIKFFINKKNPYNFKEERFFLDQNPSYQCTEEEKQNIKTLKTFDIKTRKPITRQYISKTTPLNIIHIAHQNDNGSIKLWSVTSAQQKTPDFIKYSRLIKKLSSIFHDYEITNSSSDPNIVSYQFGHPEIYISEKADSENSLKTKIENSPPGVQYINVTDEMTKILTNIMNPNKIISNPMVSDHKDLSII